MDQVVPIGTAEAIAFLVGVGIPFVVTLVTKYHAPLWVKSLISFLSAGLTAGGLWLAQTDGAHTWKGLATSFFAAVLSAASTRSTITGGADTWLGAMTTNFGIGAPKLPKEAAVAIKSARFRRP